MFRIAFSTIVHRKKNSSFYFALLLLVFILVLTVLPLFNSITSSIAAAGAAKYGTYDTIAYNITPAQLEELQSNAFAKIGTLQTYGTWHMKDSQSSNTLTLGRFDETAWALSHIQVIQGQLPTQENEIVLEENTRFRMGIDIGIGQSIELSQNSQTKTFIVTGIISNYTNFWDAPQSNALIKGVNDLPNALVSTQPQGISARLHMLAYTDGFGGEIMHLLTDWDIDTSMNNQYYVGVVRNQIESIQSFRNIFLIVIIFGIALAMHSSLSLYIDSYKNTYQTLYALGAEDTYTFRLFATQQLILLISSAVCSMPLAYLVTIVAKAILGNDIAISIFTPGTFILLGITIVVLVTLALYKFNRSIHSMRGKSISLNKSKKLKQMQIEHSLSWSLTLSFMGQTLKKVLPILLLVAILFSTVSFTNVYFQDFLQSNVLLSSEKKYPDMKAPDFRLNASESGTAYSFETLNLSMDVGRAFPSQTLINLNNLPGIRYVRPYLYATNEASLLIPTGDPYWYAYDMTWYSDVDEGHPSSVIAGAPQNVISVGYSFYVLDAKLTPAFLKDNPDLSQAVSDLEINEVIALLPPTKEGTHNQTLKEDSILRFGELTYEGDSFEAARKNPSLITYREHNLTVQTVSEKQFHANIDGMRVDSKGPVFLITEETLLQNNLFKGLFWTEIFLNEDVSEKEYAAIEQYIMETSSTLYNSNVYSRKDEAAQDKQFMEVISTALAIMLCVLGLFIVICLFTTLYMTLLQRKRSIAIMRAVGMEPKTLGRAIFMELCMYLLYCFVISVIVYFIMMYIMLAEIFSTNITLANTLSMLGSLAICIGAMLIICILIVRFLLKDVYTENVSTALRAVE